MSMAAFGTDLAWFYLNSSRVQRAADASALGGVIWMPGQQATAFSTAESIALRNGYDKAIPEVTVDPSPGGWRSQPTRGDNPRQCPNVLPESLGI
jgi:hypothetical protein